MTMPKKGDWVVMHLEVAPNNGKLVLSAVVAPVLMTVLKADRIGLKMDEKRAKTISMPFLMDRPLNAEYFIQSLRMVADEVDKLTKTIAVVRDMPREIERPMGAA